MADEVVQALGRPVKLGQLYSGLTDAFRNDFLFRAKDIAVATRIQPIPQTELTYREVRTSMDRADILNVSGKLQLSAIGNNIGDASLQAKYLRGEEVKERSETITGVLNVRTLHTRLLHQALKRQQVYTATDLSRFGVSHVVTGITYGSRLIGSFSLSQREKKKWKELSGDGTLRLVLYSGFKFTGTFVGSTDDDQSTTGNEVSVFFDSDTVDKDSPTPTDGPALLARLQRGVTGLSADFDVLPDGSHRPKGEPGVPIEVILTPLQHFEGLSTVIAFKELAAAELAALSNFYDQVLDMSRSAGTTLGELQTSSLRRFCPSLVKQAEAAVGITDELLSDTQTALATFLRNYRSDTSSQSANGFMQSRLPASVASERAIAAVEQAWKSFRILVNELTSLGKTLIGDDTIKDRMREVAGDAKASLVLFLIPPNFRRVSLLNTLSLSAGSFIDHVQKTIGEGSRCLVHAIYVDPDPSLQSDLLQIDPNPAGPVYRGLKRAATSPETLILAYGLLAGPSGRLIWKLSGDEGWAGILRNPADGSFYQGQMRNGLPHGEGKMAYCAADGELAFGYQGSWHLGKRDGLGALLGGTHLWIDNTPVGRTPPSDEIKDGHLVQVDLYAYDKLRDTRRVALYHPDGLDAKIKKIAEAFDWSENAVYLLTPPGASSVVTVKGSKIIAGRPDPALPPWLWYAWPLEDQAGWRIVNGEPTVLGSLRVDIVDPDQGRGD